MAEKKVKVRGHTRKDGTKVKAHRRGTVIARSKRRYSRTKGALAKAIRSGASPAEIRALKHGSKIDRQVVGQHKADSRFKRRHVRPRLKAKAKGFKRVSSYLNRGRGGL